MASKHTKRKNEVASMSQEEVLQQIGESTGRLKKMMFSHAITPIENPMAIRQLRKDIARLKTQLTKTESGQ